jgi:signal transduction histidine kinase
VRQALAVRQAITRNGCYIAPLVSNDKTLGALCLQSDQPFSDDVCSFIELLAMRVATALDNARLYEVAQDQLAELRQLYERLSHLEQLKTDMIRIAAHDLRSPLGIITGFSEMMLEGGTLSPRAEEQARHVFRAGQRMQKLITNILSLDRIEHLNSETDYNKINLAALVEAVFEDHEPLAAERKFSLQLPATRARISGDSPQIREAVANLMTNAIKYTPRSGDITVRLYLTEEDAVFEVTDNGYGIPVELHPDLFKPFFRVQSSETRAIEGTGLGLHLVKNIIERHNGTLHFKSTYGQGSTFGFRLPLVKTDTDELAMAGAAR